MRVSFAELKLFMKSHLLLVGLSACANLPLFRKSFYEPVHSRLFATFSSIRCHVYVFLLRSLSHLEISFMQADNMGLFWNFVYAGVQFDHH